jgi:hypothetical protein
MLHRAVLASLALTMPGGSAWAGIVHDVGSAPGALKTGEAAGLNARAFVKTRGGRFPGSKWAATLLALVLLGAVSPATAQSAAAKAATAEDSGPDPDGCALVPAADVKSALTAEDEIVRDRSGHPAPGESTCEWSAYRRGLTPDAPPDSRLSLSFHHMADSAKAHARLMQIGGGESRKPLVRTDDSDVEVARPRRETVVVRRGGDIAVVDGQTVASDYINAVGWSYRLERLGFESLGARNLRPADAHATADSCHLIDQGRLLAILTLQPARLDGTVNGPICSISLEDGAASAALEVQDMGTHAYALQFQHQISPYMQASTLVHTADGDDRVLVDPNQPGKVSAVHGPYFATLELDSTSAGTQAHPTWRYRVQRAALEAAGASIVPTPGLPPDPATPLLPPLNRDGSPGADTWTPQPHPAPAGSAVIDPILHLVAVGARLRFLVLPACIFLPLLLGWAGGAKPSVGAGPPRRRIRLAWIMPWTIAYGVLNMVFGTGVAARLIHSFGESGAATITGTYATATQYNNHDVVGFNVLIRAPDGRVLSERFQDDEFNVYPPHNATTYPDVNARFTVRYLSHFPRDFVILADDDSPWAKGMRCSRLEAKASEAHQRANFSRGRADQDAATSADAALVKAGCASTS